MLSSNVHTFCAPRSGSHLDMPTLMLRMNLFGSPQITLQGESFLEQINGRPAACFIYLAVTGQVQTRSKLVELLWDEAACREGRSRLRSILGRMRPLLEPYLLATGETLLFDQANAYWLDVQAFQNGVTVLTTQSDPTSLAALLALYQGEFLNDFSIRQAPVFEEWVRTQRQSFHCLALQGWHHLAELYRQEGNYAAGLLATQRLLVLEPWREEAHRQQMLLLALAGDRPAALTQYELCKRILATEFNLQPILETTQLYEQIRQDRLTAPISQPTQQSVTQPAMLSSLPTVHPTPVSLPAYQKFPALTPQHNVTLSTSRFYGREQEVRQLSQWVFQEGCRLVGVFGLAGQGKTELVGQVLHQAQPLQRFERVIWRSLANAPSFLLFVQGMISALGCEQPTTWPRQTETLLTLLCEHWLCQPSLLVLDNIERILQREAQLQSNHAGDAPFSAFFHWVINHSHAGCVILLSCQIPRRFSRWEEMTPQVRSLQLTGLQPIASGQLLQAYGFNAAAAASQELIGRYAGHPLALGLAAETTHDVFGGNLECFLQLQTSVFAELYERLAEQFAHFTPLERQILYALALPGAPLSFDQLRRKVSISSDQRRYLDAYRALLQYCWIESHATGASLPAVIKAFVRQKFVEEGGTEICELTMGEALPLSATLSPSPLWRENLPAGWHITQ